MTSAHTNATFRRWGLFAALAVVFLLCYFLRIVLLPFAIAAGLAFLLTPVAAWAQQRSRLPHWLAVLVVFILFLAILAGAIFWAQSILVPEALDLAHRAPQIV